MSTAAEITAQIMPILAKMAEGLGVASTHLYGVLVKQAVVWGVWNGILVIVLGLVIFISIIINNKLYKIGKSENEAKKEKYGYSHYDSFDRFTYIAPIIMICIFCLFLIAIFSYNAITGLVNPEYRAIYEIVDKLHGR